jgi:hypothetical protein
MTRLSLIALLAFAACDDKPSRPDEAKFRAMSDDDKCRATASRAIMCTDALIVADVRSMTQLDGSGLGDAMEEAMADDKPILPKSERKQNIQIHKTSCIADESYADAVFACWSIDDCKKFATCVVEKSAAMRKPAKRPDKTQR